MAMESKKDMALFGGSEKWNADDWTSSDDRVRGGKSQSYLECSPENPVARFYGNLDITTLGGAGFASQRTRKDVAWDLSAYEGIRLVVTKSDSKHYTFNVKDTLLPLDPDTGREQASISYEYDFQIPENATVSKKGDFFIPWDSFNATYRGRVKEDAPKLNTTSIKQLSVMMRSFFGTQEGAFSLSIESISASSSRTKETFAIGRSNEKRGLPIHDSRVYNGASPSALQRAVLLCFGVCALGAVVYFSSRKEGRRFYTKIWK
ncbi:hypothetical protein BLS_004223 [Venturia inaequalis]|uniref:NADH:ubiquinone oxidoreductase intermediate-associated protein 30 domain-containing protein n=1 Tax=Venturia inaequalis TaxID=5025 RepID=A0A8H3ULS9_VENIN|nr:hypothetical protein BLS_004223 [Venturia inaequalis]